MIARHWWVSCLDPPYNLTFLVGFGLLVVCKSSGRREEVKKENPAAEA